MADADDRRIIFGTHIVPKESADSEESIPQKSILMQQDSNGNTMAKTFGGKSICTDINSTQWGDSWTSMAHQNMNWEDYDDADDHSGNRWEDMVESWNGFLSVSTSGIQLTGGNSDAANVQLAFCYIRNTGDVELRVAMVGDSNYKMRIPAGASVGWRGGQTSENFYADDIYVKTGSSSTTIEYIIAIR
jgi:hypothetical protein